MKFLLDCMSGDLGCEEVILGAAEAKKTLDAEFVLFGDEAQIGAVFSAHNIPMDGFTIRHAPEIVTMEDDPTRVVRQKKESSMVMGLNALKAGEGDVFISTGNTGALLTGATLLVGRVRGVRRATIGTQMPTKTGGSVVVVDTGANAECTPEYLVQFALLGSAYVETIAGVRSPRIALLSNGTEEHKGNALVKQTHEELKKLDEKGLVHFVGNMEARDLFSDVADVIVCDGFTGNVMLKAVEGTASFVMSLIKNLFLSSFVTKIAALLVKSKLGSLKTMMDYRSVGGTPILGIAKPVFKAHGASDRAAWASAIRSAAKYVDCGTAKRISEIIEKFKETENDGNGDPAGVD